MPIDFDLLKKIREADFTASKLVLSEQNINDGELDDLILAIKKNEYIKELDVSNNQISDDGAEKLADLKLESLDISGNKIGFKGCIALAKSGLQKLNISANSIGDGVAAFSSSISLVELIAVECEITDEGAKQLFLSKAIKKLDLSTNNILGACLVSLTSNLILEDLDLSQNNISGNYLEHVSKNVVIIRLNLMSNFIGDEGAVYLAKNNSIKELVLSQCFIKDAGAIALSENKILEKLILSNNRITGVGVKALSNNRTLLHLDLQSNLDIDMDALTQLEVCYVVNEGLVFTRSRQFIIGLLRNDLVASSDDKIGLTLGESVPLFTPQRNTDQAQPNIAERTAELILLNPDFEKFFINATSEQISRCFTKLQELSAKKRKLNPPEGGIKSN